MPIFDRFNTSFQASSTATIHRLHGETTILTLDLTKLNFSEISNHLADEDLFETIIWHY